jgi:hypothetical protein
MSAATLVVDSVKMLTGPGPHRWRDREGRQRHSGASRDARAGQIEHLGHDEPYGAAL